MRQLKLAAIIGLIAVLTIATPASAAKFGQPDDGEHPYVGQLLFYVPDAIDPRFDDPGGWFTCSATLVSATIVLTAGHCTFAVGLDGESTTGGGEATTTADGGDGGNDIWINFSEEPDFSILPPSSDFVPDDNEGRYDAWSTALNTSGEWLRGTAHPHPQYDDNLFWHFDAGVVELQSPIAGPTGEVPTEDWLEQYGGPAHAEQTFEVVGFGVTRALPFATFGGDTRVKAEVWLHTLNAQPRDSYGVFSNTPSARASGGTCFGDSGGPIFDNTSSNLVVAVNSWVRSGTCSGQSGGYRIDQPDDLAFLAEYGVTP